MGTYDTRGGTPRHDPMFDEFPPCDLCGVETGACACPKCPECGTVGDVNCLRNHGMKPTRGFIMEVQVRVGSFATEWKAVRPSGPHAKPYLFSNLPQAEWMMRICYPDAVRDMRLGADNDEAGVRITPVDEKWLSINQMGPDDYYPLSMGPKR